MNLNEKKLLKRIIKETILAEQRTINEGFVDTIRGVFQKPKPKPNMYGQDKPYELKQLNANLDPFRGSPKKVALANMIRTELGQSAYDNDQYAAIVGAQQSNSKDTSAKSYGNISDENINKYSELFKELKSQDRKQLILYYEQFDDTAYKKLIAKFKNIDLNFRQAARYDRDGYT